MESEPSGPVDVQTMGNTTVIYVRDTNETESAQQEELGFDYAKDVLGLDPSDVLVLSDTAVRGRNADDSGDQKLFQLAEAGDLERVIVRDAARIATSMRDLHERLTRLVNHDVAVHIIEPGIRINDDALGPADTMDDHTMRRAIGIAAEMESSLNSERTREGIAAAQAAGKHVGRPPFGFDSDGDGNLVPNDDFDTALAVIEEIEAGNSKRSVARRAGITRATVRNILDRKELYLGY